MIQAPFNPVLEDILSTKETVDKDGNKRNVDDMISRSEAKILTKLLKLSNAKTTIEVGLAHGVSALVFCQALKENGNKNSCHYAVDPNQFTSYKSAGITAVGKAGYSDLLNLLPGPSHIEIPKLIEKKVVIDCALIDGWHTFDYTLIDFFLIDKMLRPGGYVAFHDTYGRNKQKVIDFLLSHRKYKISAELMKFDKEPFIRTLKFFLWRLYKDPMLFFSRYHWKFQLKNSAGLMVLQKEADFEPNYDFFKNF